MEVSTVIIGVLGLIYFVITILAIFEVFRISSTLRKILAAIKAADNHRREEFDSMTPES